MAETAKWYVVHTYSGYENTVMATIEKTVETRQLQDIIQQVSIPMETVTEVTEKGPKTYDRKVFPGYVLVKMVMTDDAWYIIKNVRGVTGFVGSANKAIPLTEEEVLAMGMEKDEKRWEEYLVLAMGRCAERYEKLPLVQDKALLDNILYSGVWVNYRGKRKEEAANDG